MGGVGLSLARESRYGVGALMRRGVLGSLDSTTVVGRTRVPAFEAFGATKVKDVWPKLGMAVTSKEAAAAATGLTASVTAKDLPGKLGVGSAAKPIRADIGSWSPSVMGGVKQDPARFGLFGGRNDTRGVLGLTASASDLFAGMDSRWAVKRIGADLGSLASLTGAASASARVADLGAGRPAVDLGRELGLGSAVAGLLGRADVSRIAEQMRADIGSWSPSIVSGVKQDAGCFGLFGGFKEAGGIFAVRSSAGNLFGSNDIASFAKQMALGSPHLLEALRRVAIEPYEMPLEEAEPAKRDSIDAFVLQWLQGLPAASRWKLLLAFVGFLDAVETELETKPMEIADAARMHIYAAVAVVAFVWAVVDASRN